MGSPKILDQVGASAVDTLAVVDGPHAEGDGEMGRAHAWQAQEGTLATQRSTSCASSWR
ncbi:MAG TPA: hypothetical protein VG815_21770 [Chloroflexota bacterium]|nr:hypothetical protein [Chloroflexota bacterium]